MFYLIENNQQLTQLKLRINSDVFLGIIQNNDNFHPAISNKNISLIYIYVFSEEKGFIISLNHTESFSLNISDILEILQNINKIYVLDKKFILHYFPTLNNIYDINYINILLNKPKIEYSSFNTPCHDVFIQRNNINYPNINTIIPISKHYEKWENIWKEIHPSTFSYNVEDKIYKFNNIDVTDAFYNIEKNGIKINKNNYIKHFSHIKYPEFNIKKGFLYSMYSLYNNTGRPSNRFNEINFAALDKKDNSREFIIPNNDELIEFDFTSYHPLIISEILGYNYNTNESFYKHISEKLELSEDISKKILLKQIYGEVEDKYKDIEFFSRLKLYTENLEKAIKEQGYIKTKLRIFKYDEKINIGQLLSWIIQSEETSRNVEVIQNITKLLDNKKSKLILYTYDSFTLDYSKEDGEDLIENIKKIMKHNIKIKRGLNYNF